MLIFLWKKNASTVTDSQFSLAFLFVFILKSLSLPFTSVWQYEHIIWSQFYYNNLSATTWDKSMHADELLS